MARPRMGIKCGSESIGRLTVIGVRADRNHGAIRSDDVEIKLPLAIAGPARAQRNPTTAIRSSTKWRGVFDRTLYELTGKERSPLGGWS